MEFILNLVFALFFVATVFFAIAVFRYYYKKPKGAPDVNIIEEFKNKANIKENIIDGRKIYEIENKNEVNPNATIVYLHGGAYIGGITRRHINVLYKFLNDTKMKIILPDYPLAPKHTFVDVFDLLEKLCDEYKNEKNLIFMGDSAGGALALAMAQKSGEENKKQPKKMILISPWLDITLKNEKIPEIEKSDKVLNRKVLKFAADKYCGELDQDNYLVSPINGPLDKIDNIVIFTGTKDILNPDAHIFKEKIEQVGDIKFKFFEKENVGHNWIFEDLENSKEDYERVVEEILNFDN